MSGSQQSNKERRAVLPDGDAPAADLRSADWKDGKFVFPLAKKVLAYGDERSTLIFREPGGGDILECGNPVKFDPAASPPTVEFHDARMGAMMARLADVPLSTIAQMAPKDFVAACWVLSPFFMPI